MKITIVTGPFYPVPPAPCGAVERIWHDLGEYFAAAGHEVTVLCRHWPGQIKNETIKNVRYVRRTRMSHTRSIYWDLVQDMWYSIRMFLLTPRADVTVTNVFWLPAMMRWRPSAGKVVINLARWPKGQVKLYRRVARLAVPSGAIAKETERQCPECAPLVKVLPNPIDTTIFSPPQASRPANAGRGTILYTGRVHPEKGLHVLVDAFHILCREFPELRLRVCGATSIAGGGGGDPYIAQLKQAAAGLKLEMIEPIYDRVALAREIQSADYYCYPSLAEQGESFGVAPLEAMATGLAPVVSALEVFHDFLEDGRNGLVFDHRSADPAGALAAAIGRLVRDPGEAQRLGQAAVQTAQRFSYQNVARFALEDFAELTGSAA